MSPQPDLSGLANANPPAHPGVRPPLCGCGGLCDAGSPCPWWWLDARLLKRAAAALAETLPTSAENSQPGHGRGAEFPVSRGTHDVR